MAARLALIGVIFLLGAGVIARGTTSEPTPIRQSFDSFPMEMDGWVGTPGERFDQEILDVLGVDEYVNLVYAKPKEAGVGLYIGYYQSQRQGDAIHSPMNCLPGAGWEPMAKSSLTIPVTENVSNLSNSSSTPTRSIDVNRYVIQKGTDKMLAIYWYQSQGRVIASEYTSKIFMVLDAMRTARTDAALVRVLTPFSDRDANSESAAERRAMMFIQAMFPRLTQYLPS
jgi:EpsI family protein